MPITYPVSKDARFALVRKSDRAILCRDGSFQISPKSSAVLLQKWPRVDGGPLGGLPATLAPAIAVIDPDPVYDPATSKLEPGILLRPADQEIHFQRVIVELTVSERDAREKLLADQARRDALIAAVATLRDWETQASDVTVTTGNIVGVTQTLVDRTGTFFGKFADLLELQAKGLFP